MAARKEPKYLNYTVNTVDGLIYTGILASETGTSLTLLSPENKQQVILRNEIEEMQSSGKSMLPKLAAMTECYWTNRTMSEFKNQIICSAPQPNWFELILSRIRGKHFGRPWSQDERLPTLPLIWACRPTQFAWPNHEFEPDCGRRWRVCWTSRQPRLPLKKLTSEATNVGFHFVEITYEGCFG